MSLSVRPAGLAGGTRCNIMRQGMASAAFLTLLKNGLSRGDVPTTCRFETTARTMSHIGHWLIYLNATASIPRY
jgi:hypothetical protein